MVATKSRRNSLGEQSSWADALEELVQHTARDMAARQKCRESTMTRDSSRVEGRWCIDPRLECPWRPSQ
ncbi:MAG: hypothetical protein P8M11_11345 [Planctomycetota bacterium]|nr:hypothetical protein [Planctomycetota bacterium]